MFCHQEVYGKADEACVAKVKELYKVLDLQVSLSLPHLSSLHLSGALFFIKSKRKERSLLNNPEMVLWKNI